MNDTNSTRNRVWPILFGCVLLAVGLALIAGGVQLAMAGGSWYYLIGGVFACASGVLYILGARSGFWVFACLFAGTVVWAFWEVGLVFWPLVPRLSHVLVLAIPALLLAPHLAGNNGSARPWYVASGIVALLVIACAAAMLVPHGVVRGQVSSVVPGTPKTPSSNDWPSYGRTVSGTRFVTAEQITKKNVNQLEMAWTFRTGELAVGASENQNTPLEVGDTVYLCTPTNKVFALDADTGEERWHFDPGTKANGKWQRCRGVSFYDGSAANAAAVPSVTPATAACGQRVVTSTIDGRLIALDAATGASCKDFGDNGAVDLKRGMGEIKNAYYIPTSAPLIAGDVILVGGWVYDNQEVNEPTGAVRAFDARTGKIAWAWDVGNPDLPAPPPDDYVYTRGTPNVWSTPAFDPKLGLVYLPTGNATPDYYGGKRRDFDERNSSSIVALDVKTGQVRWRFQTVHHDLWDYDVPAQPALYDLPDGKGATIPALVQVTKRGQIFVLDRRSGEPIRKVEERPVPQGAAPGDRLSPTQPYSVEMPAMGGQHLQESDMWGATVFDQMICRIAFKSVRYDGEFTPPRPDSIALQFNGNYGGMNWGSASINEDTGTLIVNDIRLPLTTELVTPRPGPHPPGVSVHGGKNLYSAQAGLPYAVITSPFMSPLGIPCIAPPWGAISAIDLATGKLQWQRPGGTVKEARLGGVRASVPIPLGMPTLGGPFTTRSGLVFHSGTQDYYLRAYDLDTGDELWKAALPVGAQATPMSYVSPKSGRQFVVVTAGGARQSPDRGDYVIAFALPKAGAK